MTNVSQQQPRARHYVERPEVVSAVQWFKNGDHPDDNCQRFESGEFAGQLMEGHVVRYFRSPNVDGETICAKCSASMHDHGWLDDVVRSDENVVCPGDYIITRSNNSRTRMNAEAFRELFDEVVIDDNDTIYSIDVLMKTNHSAQSFIGFLRTAADAGRKINRLARLTRHDITTTAIADGAAVDNANALPHGWTRQASRRT